MIAAMPIKRHAFTLIEISALIVAEVLVVGLTIGVLCLVFEVNHRDRRSESARMATPKLATQFRDDVRLAKSATIETDGSLRLSLDSDEWIKYSFELAEIPAHSICRREKFQGENRAETEKYVLPDNVNAWFSIGTEKFNGLVALNIWTKTTDRRGNPFQKSPPPEALNSFTREVRDDAVPRQDLRYSGNWRTIVARLKV